MVTKAILRMLLLGFLSLALLASTSVLGQVDNTKYNIQIKFVTAPPTAAKASFDAAVARWQQVIVGDIGSTITIKKGQSVCGQGAAAADIVVDDLLIFADITAIDGVGKVLGSSGPCGRDNNGFVRLGSMQFDIADVNNLIATNKFTSTVLHEMGHIIGIGGNWAVQGLVSPTAQGTPFRYLGAQGAVGQKEIGGSGQPIVEDTGGAGTARVHWKETVYQNELMTGFLSGNTQPLSRLTVRSLVDMGYKVDLTKADDFSIAAVTKAPTKTPTKAPTTAGATKSPTTTTKSPTNAPTVAGGGFNIQLVFSPTVSDSQKAVFNSAAARWEKVITGDIGNTVTLNAGTQICGQTITSAINIDDILIFADVSAIDGVGQILGQAGPCGFDNAGRVRLGSMQFDTADVNNLQAQNKLQATILHEMGHVLGIGTVWDQRNLISPGNAPFLYQGAGGNQGQLDIGGTGKAIIEDTGGAGTARGHWKETVYQNELMTGFLSGSTQPMSKLTVESLKDIGYTVDVTQADDFTIPSATGRRLRDLKDKDDREKMAHEHGIEERDLAENQTEWEKGYPTDKIVWNLPTQDKTALEDGSLPTEWESAYAGEVASFTAEPKASPVGAIAGAVVGVLGVVGAAAAFVVIRKRKSSMAGQTAALNTPVSKSDQVAAGNPMFNTPQQSHGYAQQGGYNGGNHV